MVQIFDACQLKSNMISSVRLSIHRHIIPVLLSSRSIPVLLRKTPWHGCKLCECSCVTVTVQYIISSERRQVHHHFPCDCEVKIFPVWTWACISVRIKQKLAFNISHIFQRPQHYCAINFHEFTSSARFFHWHTWQWPLCLLHMTLYKVQ